MKLVNQSFLKFFYFFLSTLNFLIAQSSYSYSNQYLNKGLIYLQQGSILKAIVYYESAYNDTFNDKEFIREEYVDSYNLTLQLLYARAMYQDCKQKINERHRQESCLQAINNYKQLESIYDETCIFNQNREDRCKNPWYLTNFLSGEGKIIRETLSP